MLGVISLAGTCESVSRARAEVRHWLGDDHPAIDDVTLAVSELVTNAVVHSGVRTEDALHLTLTETEGVIGVEVTDPGATASAPRLRGEPAGEGGRGLLIVREISLAWGVREYGCGLGRTVWCAIGTTPSFPDPSVPRSPLE